MKKFFLGVAKGLMSAVPFVAGSALYRDSSDQIGWFLIAAEGILIAITFVPWSSLSFGQGRQVAYNYMAPTPHGAPSPVASGPGIFHNLGTNMKPYLPSLVGIAFAIGAWLCGYKAYYDDEPTLWYIGFLVCTVASITCFMVQGGVLKDFLTNVGTKHLADAGFVLCLVVASVFYVYAKEEGLPSPGKSVGFAVSIGLATLAFFTARGWIGPIAKEIGHAYMGKPSWVLAVCLWLSSMGMVAGLIHGMKKFEILEDYEWGAALMEHMSLGMYMGIFAGAALALTIAGYMDYQRISKLRL